jgi:hypothetical protein
MHTRIVVPGFDALSRRKEKQDVARSERPLLSCFSFWLSYLPIFPRLPLLTLPIVLIQCPRPLVGFGLGSIRVEDVVQDVVRSHWVSSRSQPLCM